MRKLIISLSLLLSACSSNSGLNWSYVGDNGPQAWGDLEEDFALCSEGTQQSPIDILPPFPPGSAVGFAYSPSALELGDSGHGKLFKFSDSGFLQIGGERYYLDSMHMHSPSEHRIAGSSAPIEMHFVHKTKGEQPKIAVVGVFVKSGLGSPAVEDLLKMLEGGSGKPLSPQSFFPESQEYYRYTGSLTTPPCTEGVQWHVMAQPLEADPGQLTRLQRFVSAPSNRPVQARNGRAVQHVTQH